VIAIQERETRAVVHDLADVTLAAVICVMTPGTQFIPATHVARVADLKLGVFHDIAVRTGIEMQIDRLEAIEAEDRESSELQESGCHRRMFSETASTTLQVSSQWTMRISVHRRGARAYERTRKTKSVIQIVDLEATG